MANDEDLIVSAQLEIDNKLQKFKGMKVSELKEHVGITTKDNKASFVSLARKMLGISSNQFTLCDGKVDAVLKTVRVTGMKNPAESMSFMPVNFDEWINSPSWVDSSLYKYFKEKTLILFIFQQYPSGQRVDDNEMTFYGVKVWKMSNYDLNHGLKEVWDEVCSLLNENRLEISPVIQKNGQVINKNNLPKSGFNDLGHLRPGAKNGDDKILLPTGQTIVKQRFWFNSEYVKEILGL